MKYSVMLLFFLMPLGMVGAAKTVAEKALSIRMIKGHGARFSFMPSATRRLCSATHAVFSLNESSGLPELVRLSDRASKPVPNTVSLSPKGSFWYAPLLDKNNQCLWFDRVDTDSSENKHKSGLRSISLPDMCNIHSDIFWSSDESVVCIFDRKESNVMFYVIDGHDSNLIDGNHFCVENIGFNVFSDVRSMAYDPITHSIAAICSPSKCTPDKKCGMKNCFPGHAIASLCSLTLPVRKERYVFALEKLFRSRKTCIVDYGNSPTLQYSDDGGTLLYAFNKAESSQRRGIVIVHKEGNLHEVTSFDADQICFAKTTKYIFLYSKHVKDPTQGVLGEYNCYTRFVKDCQITDMHSGILHADGLIGFNRDGIVKRVRLFPQAEKNSAADTDEGKGTTKA